MFVRRFLTTICFTAMCLTALPAGAQQTLQWKFQPGEVLKYRIRQDVQRDFTLGGNSNRTVMSQTIEMTWKVENAAADGSGVLTQTIDRMMVSLEGGPTGQVNFDTASQQAPDNPIARVMSDTFRKLINQPFRVTMQPTGKVTSVDVPPDLLQAIRSSAAGAVGAMSEEQVKKMLLQSSVYFPAEAVSPNVPWESVQEMTLPTGTLKISNQLAWLRNDDAGNAVISLKPTLSIVPAENAPTQLTIEESSGQGQVLFDLGGGHIRQSTLQMSMKMVSEHQGQKINEVMQQTTVMQLVP